MVVAEETRKGPWTEEEDRQLVYFVRLFGERRWDFIAKMSGLHRTGKSCRLRWVNYLHPGLKRGRMSPQEERLILELHARWGNRWSRIARKLPGRTDNEIKNYWRTHMRKKAQERRRGSASELPTPSSSCSSSLGESGGAGPVAPATRPVGTPDSAWEPRAEDDDDGAYPMERIWEAIASAEVRDGGGGCAASPPLWDYFVEPPAWKVESGGDWSSQLWCEDSKLCYP